MASLGRRRARPERRLARWAAVTACAAVLLAACQVQTDASGRTVLSLPSANQFLGAPQGLPAQPAAAMAPAGSTALAGNDVYVRSVVPDAAIRRADAEFDHLGLRGTPDVLERCVADARRHRGDVPMCWALDIHATIANIAVVNVPHGDGIPFLDEALARQRWHVYADALGVPPTAYQRVEDGTFQRVLSLVNAHVH